MGEKIKSLYLIINITYCISSLIITIINYLKKKIRRSEIIMYFLIITIINYLQKKIENQKPIIIIISSLIITIINYHKKLEKEKEKFYLHPLYFSTHPIKKTHTRKYTFTLKPNFSICFFFCFISLHHNSILPLASFV